MRSMLGRVALVAIIGIAVGASGLWADEAKIALDKLPKPVVDAVKKRFPKAELLEAAKETEDKKTTYEVTLKDGGKKHDVIVTPEGVITTIEKEIAASDTKAVKDAINTKYPKATWKVTEEVTAVKDGKEAIDFYEVLLETTDKKTFEVQVAPDGKIKATEEKKEEKK